MNIEIRGIAAAKADRAEYQIPFAAPPVRPEIMNNIVASLTDEQIADLPRVKAGYDAALRKWRDSTRVTEDMSNQLRADLEGDFGMTDHPKRDVLWAATVSNTGGFNGTNDRAKNIISVYGDLHQLAR